MVDLTVDELWEFWYLDQSGQTWEEYQNEPQRIARRRMAWYQAKISAGNAAGKQSQ